MKFLHTSDWHLGMGKQGGGSYLKDQEFVINKICELAEKEKVDGILLAGDVFDRSIASHEALQLYDKVMSHICLDLDIPVYLIAGNHDGADRISQCNELLKKSGLYIAGALEEKPQVVHLGDVDIYLLPWISTDKVKALYTEEAEQIQTLEDAYQIVLDHYRADFIPGHNNILVSHAYIIEGETSTSDRAAVVGNATVVSAQVFEGFDYVALGHLHGPQSINESIRYSGTPMAYSFGSEEKQTKSVTILDTETMEQKIVPLEQLYKRTTLTGTYQELSDADFDDEIVKGYVRLIVTDQYLGLNAVAALRETYPNMLEYSGPGFEREDAQITMTVEELEQARMNPSDIFERYCEDILEELPSEHFMKLFQDALNEHVQEEM